MKSFVSHTTRLCLMATMAFTTAGSLNTQSPDAHQLFEKTKPLDVKNPLVLLNKRQSNELDVYNFGIDTTLSLGYDEDYVGEHSVKTQVSDFEFKFLYLINPWMSAHGKMYLDNSALPTSLASPPNFMNRLSNSRMVLSDGYLVFGNLDLSPVYGYWGQVALPYGKNSAPSSTTNLSARMHQINQRAVAAGFYKEMNGHTINSEAFFFNGDSKPIATPDVPTYGVNFISSSSDSNCYNWELKAGWLSNIADTNGFQRTVSSIPGSSTYAEFDYGDDATLLRTPTTLSNNFVATGGFATSKNFEKIQHRVPGASISIKFVTANDITLSSAYSTALRSFDYRDLTYRDTGVMFSDTAAPTADEGAHPSAWNAYIEKKLHKGIEVYTGIEGTNQALALSVPKKRWIIGASKKIDAFTKLSLEVKQDRNYGLSTDALGPTRSDVSSTNAVHLDGNPNNMTYSIAPTTVSGDGSNTRGKTATDIVFAIKVKF